MTYLAFKKTKTFEKQRKKSEKMAGGRVKAQMIFVKGNIKSSKQKQNTGIKKCTLRKN